MKTNADKLKIAREVFEHIALQNDYAGMLARNALDEMRNSIEIKTEMIPDADGYINTNLGMETIHKIIRRRKMLNIVLKHFKAEEFTCKCGCGENEMKHDFLNKLDSARDIAEIPFHMNSAYRCKTHNILVGGTPDSSHPKGWAGDIAVPNSTARFKILDALLAAGFVRIGVYKNFIHADCDPDKDREVIWHGSK